MGGGGQLTVAHRSLLVLFLQLLLDHRHLLVDLGLLEVAPLLEHLVEKIGEGSGVGASRCCGPGRDLQLRRLDIPYRSPSMSTQEEKSRSGGSRRITSCYHTQWYPDPGPTAIPSVSPSPHCDCWLWARLETGTLSDPRKHIEGVRRHLFCFLQLPDGIPWRRALSTTGGGRSLVTSKQPHCRWASKKEVRTDLETGDVVQLGLAQRPPASLTVRSLTGTQSTQKLRASRGRLNCARAGWLESGHEGPRRRTEGGTGSNTDWT
jgi:hypothetical protein